MSIYARSNSAQMLQSSRYRGALEPTFGLSSDQMASVVQQGEGPVVPGTGQGCPLYQRIPVIVKAQNGDYLLFTDARSASADTSGYAILQRRSTDQGRTWGTPTTVYSHSTFVAGTDWIVAGSAVVDLRGAGSITYIFTQSSTTVHKIYITRSTDHGATWGAASEITSAVKVVDGSTPSGHTYGATAWAWCVPGCSGGIQLTSGANAGRLIVPFDHRLTSFVTPSYSHTIKSDDGGANWTLHGGVAETAANQYTNECAITETATANRLLMHCRNVNSGQARKQSISTDGGATWADVTTLSNLVGSDAAGDVKQCGELIVASYTSDPLGTNRNSMTLAISRDQGVTWAAADRRMVYGRPAAYSVLLVDGNRVFLVFERSQDNVSGTNMAVWAHSIALLATNKTWLLNPTPRYSEWFFNEEASGTVGLSFGGEIPDFGNLDERAVCGTSAAPPTYTATGIAVTSSADHINLSQVLDPAFYARSGDSLSIEIEATITAASNGVLVSQIVTSTGWMLECNSGKLKATFGDGTNTPTITGATTINDGVRRAYAVVRDAANSQLRLYVDGVQDTTAVTDTSGNCTQSGSGVLAGMRLSGTPIDAVLHSARITRGVVSTFIQAGRAKVTQAALRRYTPPTLAATPIALGGLALWTHQTYNGGIDAYADAFLTDRYPVPPPFGASIRSMHDGSTGRKRLAGSEFRRLVYFNDAKMGPCWYTDYSNSVAAYIVDTNAYGATNGFDFIQNTGVFTIAGCFNIKQSTSGQQYIAGSNGSTASKAGFAIYRNDGAASKLTFHVSTGPNGTNTNRISETISTAPAIAYGTTYFFAFVGRGEGAKVDLYIAPISANYNASSPTIPTVTKYQSSANFAAVAGAPFTTTSVDILYLGAYSGGGGLNGYLKNFMLFNTSLTDQNVTDLATFCVSG